MAAAWEAPCPADDVLEGKLVLGGKVVDGGKEVVGDQMTGPVTGVAAGSVGPVDSLSRTLLA